MDLAFLCRYTADEHLFFPFDQGCADNDLESDIIGLKLKEMLDCYVLIPRMLVKMFFKVWDIIFR